MEDDVLKVQIYQWLSRRVSSFSTRDLSNEQIAIGSDIGIQRTTNQDRAVVMRAQVSKSRYFYVGVLCDGMGGLESGQECAALATASFLVSCLKNRGIKNQSSRLEKATIEANLAVFSKYNGGGGATLSAFICDSEGEFNAVNVGDSRIYSSDRKKLRQMSVDDTLAGHFKRPEVNPEDRKLLQYIGMGPEIQPHIIDLSGLPKGEQLILTSDGAHSLSHESLSGLLQHADTVAEATKRMLYLSRWCGGHDNATVILVNDLQRLTNEQNDYLSGSIQLWDSSGDMQFVGIKGEIIFKDDFQRDSEKDELCTGCEGSEQEKESESSQLKQVSKLQSDEKSTRKDSRKKKGKHQLRMDFNEPE